MPALESIRSDFNVSYADSSEIVQQKSSGIFSHESCVSFFLYKIQSGDVCYVGRFLIIKNSMEKVPFISGIVSISLLNLFIPYEYFMAGN